MILSIACNAFIGTFIQHIPSYTVLKYSMCIVQLYICFSGCYILRVCLHLRTKGKVKFVFFYASYSCYFNCAKMVKITVYLIICQSNCEKTGYPLYF